MVLINTAEKSYIQIYNYGKKGFKEQTKLILSTNDPSYALTSIKSWREVTYKDDKKIIKVYFAVGDSYGNVKIRVQTQDGDFKMTQKITNAHDMEITGIEYIKYCRALDHRCIVTTSKDG